MAAQTLLKIAMFVNVVMETSDSERCPLVDV